MPLIVDGVPERATKGNLLRWLLDTDLARKAQVGTIALRGRKAVIEVPESAGKRLAERLDGTKLLERRMQVWFEAESEGGPADEHFQRLSRWLEMESRAEAEQAREWLNAEGDRDSSTRLSGLVVREEDTGLGGYTLLTLGRKNAMQPLPSTRLNVGAPIQLTEGETSWRGVVTRLVSHTVEVALAKPPVSDANDPVFRLDAANDEIALERSRSALARARAAAGDRLSELRDVFTGQREPAFDEPAKLDVIDPNLNPSQQEAIAHALSARDFAVIHGPPGTGKTRTLVELIRQAVRRGERVLACAPSNLGVDNLFERLLDAGESVIRLGHPVRVLPHLRDRTIGAMARVHPDVKPIRKQRREANDLFRKADRGSTDRDTRRELRDEAKAILHDARAAEADIVQDLLSNADVVCATNTGLNASLLGGRRFAWVVIDEACQCAEPACWIPLQRADRLVLAGDHCQLPPTILSPEAAAEGFSVSLQERMVEQFGDRVMRTLKEQYRMHEAIMGYSSSVFYNDELTAHPSVAGHRLCDLPEVTAEESTETPLHYIDTSGAEYEEEQETGGSSYRNPDEARLAAKKVRDLLAVGVRPEDIAVITPYSAQVGLLRETVENTAVEVGSIDGFQGREKEAVIISLVRCNKTRQIGFLRDVRRMNVAMTRARRKLIVIGDSATITADPFYANFLEHVDLYDAYHVVWEEEE